MGFAIVDHLLTVNNQMPTVFDSHAYNRDSAAIGGQNGWQVNEMATISGYSRNWFHRSAVESAPLRLYISAGIHGDEPAGPWAAAELLGRAEWFAECEVFLFPLLNPAGMEQGTRENLLGVDLNRDYRHPRSDEVLDHIKVLDRLPRCHVHLHLHEDWEATGAYLYAVHPESEPSAADVILRGMGRHLPIEYAAEIDGFPSVEGVIRPGYLPERDEWPEGYYMAHRHGTYHGYTLETPSSYPLHERVAALVESTRELTEFMRANRLALQRLHP